MPQNAPKVSIILPTYNGSRYIQKAIQGCLNQTCADLELIIIDDASTDRTVEMIQSFHDSRLALVRLDKNQGHIAALNKGFLASRGDFLTWTSDDNYYAPDAISRMLQELTHDTTIDFVYTKYHVIDEEGHILRQGRTEDPAYLDIDNCVGGCFLYRRKVYEQIGDFNPEAFLAEDYEYWLRVRRQFNMKKMDDILYFYREHPKSLTGVHKEERVQEQVQKVRERYLPWGKKIYFKTMRQLRRIKQLLRV